MGQAHKFMNFDKKEFVEPDCWFKLTEWSYQGNSYMQKIESLLKNTWKGDRVLVVGQYVDEYYEGYNFSPVLSKIREENIQEIKDNIYSYDYKELKPKGFSDIPTRYIYNHNKKQFVDLKNQPIQQLHYIQPKNKVSALKFHPLSLLLDCSNGSGGGDYRGANEDLVGSWVEDLGKIEISDNKLNLDYEELNIKFDEIDQKKSDTELIVDCLSDFFKDIDKSLIDKIKFEPLFFLSESEQENIKKEVKNKILSKNEKEPEKEEEIEK